MIKIEQKIRSASVVPVKPASDPAPKRRLPMAPVIDQLRWPSRPETPDGTMGWTSPVVRDSRGGKFAVTVNYIQNGVDQPFEVFVPFNEAPRGLAAVARLLSFDMRTLDRGWLARKLRSLAAIGGDPLTIQVPGQSAPMTVGSPVAALAHYVRHACQRVGWFGEDDAVESPMARALMFPSEPKAQHGDLGTAHYFDVQNAGKDDDFRVFLAETDMDDGIALPHSVWFVGQHPATWHGIAKILSKDMQIADPAWIGLKLVTLREDTEAMGDFMAWDPIAKKNRTFSSSLAFVAQSILARYVALGILDEQGRVVSRQQMKLFADDPLPITPVAAPVAASTCPKCHEPALVMLDGCPTCTACGHSKCG